MEQLGQLQFALNQPIHSVCSHSYQSFLIYFLRLCLLTLQESSPPHALGCMAMKMPTPRSVLCLQPYAYCRSSVQMTFLEPFEIE